MFVFTDATILLRERYPRQPRDVKKTCKQWEELPINWCRISEPSTVSPLSYQKIAAFEKENYDFVFTPFGSRLFFNKFPSADICWYQYLLTNQDFMRDRIEAWILDLLNES